ncbi:N-acetyltransferase [Flavobacterium coralii]|uniref:GNAT family N-acetyltransferase n=1 Tax=Flavobacterium coralii TaxID=2838017 RepID=UPI000C4AD2DE|nr:GNAT family N-acetyltransferase [Flavobacterium sp.]|tara:strand:- start:41214 stop:41678 length:465 start_codon:yes stop_codon:yes gene_type:complete
MIEKIRPVVHSDLNDLKNVVDSSELFPAEYLDGMISEYFNNPQANDIWFTYVEDNKPVAIGYCVPEKLTDGTYNLLAIGVAKDFQRKGIATAMMSYIEKTIEKLHGRILIVETSTNDAQAGAISLYKNIGYTHMATIKDFWSDGEDKLVFWKKV